MPNAILRAGPFGYQVFDESIPNEYFQNEPTSPTNLNIVPINCADFTGSTKWSWKSWYVTAIDPFNVILVTANQNQSSVTKSFSNGSFGFEGEGLYFAYQAAETFTLAGTFVAGGAEGQEDDISFTIKDTGNDVEFFNFNNGTRNISGSYSITLPAAVKPIFISLTFFGGIDPTGRITITGINPA